MKNYKMVIISLLLLIFLVGAVSAADENATDSLEVSNDVIVEESVDSLGMVDSNVQEELGVSDANISSDNEVLTDDDFDGVTVYVDDDTFFDPIKFLYGEEKYFKAKFVDWDDNTYPNKNVTFHIINWQTVDWESEDPFAGAVEINTVTDENAVASFLMDFDVGSYGFYNSNIDGIDLSLQGVISVYDPSVKGYIRLENYGGNQDPYQVISCDQFAKYTVYVMDNMENTLPNTLFYYSINGVTYNATTSQYGSAILEIGSLPAANHTLVVSYPEFNVTANATLYVLEDISPIHGDNMTVVGGEFEYVVLITDKLQTPQANGWATMMVGSQRFGPVYADENGIAIFDVSLDVGVYKNVRIWCKDGIVYRDFIVLANSSIVETGVEDSDKISLSFTDINGTALANVEVKFLIGDETYNAATDANGVASFDLSVLPLGDYNVTVVNPATGQKTIKSVSLTTNETIFADDVSAVFNNNSKFSAFFTDKYGKALANTNVTFIVGNETIIATTDDNGVAEFIVSALMDAGNHTVTIKNPVAGEITKTLTINKTKSILKASDVSMTYNVPKNLVITLIDPNDGSFLRNKSVTILLNGQTYNKVTNDNGQVTLSVNLAAKTYDAKITFAGDKNYIDSQATAKINVAKANAKMTAKKATFKAKTKTKKYSIVLKDNKNKALSKVKVTIKVKGKTYKATTNSKGKATFKITKLTKKGKHTAKVKFAGNNNFKALSKSVKITIK